CMTLLHQPLSLLFPYTTLFRSVITLAFTTWVHCVFQSITALSGFFIGFFLEMLRSASSVFMSSFFFLHASHCTKAISRGPLIFRSEEHTSELQSRENLVCRLLL